MEVYLDGRALDSRAFGRKAVEQLIDLRLCPHVNSTCRLIKNKEVAFCRKPFTNDNLLLIAAGELTRQLFNICRCDFQFLPVSFPCLILSFPIEKAIGEKSEKAGTDDIFLDRLAKQQSLVLPVLRQKGYAAPDALLGCRAADGFSIEDISSTENGVIAKNSFGYLGSACADKTG